MCGVNAFSIIYTELIFINVTLYVKPLKLTKI
jgi:hypothetical protein